MATSEILLPLKINQVFELANQLPKSQKIQLANLLLDNEKAAISSITEEQKMIVRRSVEAIKTNPSILVSENDAWKMIDTNE